MYRVLLPILIGLFTITNCAQLNQLNQALGTGGNTEEDSQNDLLLASALLLALQSDNSSSCACTIGDTCFTPGDGVTCTNGTATGTGTLLAGSSGDFVSLAATVTLNATGSTIKFNTGNSTDISTEETGITLRESGTGNHQYFGSLGTGTFGGTAASPAAGASTTFCLESHLTEGHVLVRNGGCPTSSTAVTAAAAGSTDEDENMAGDSGRLWGFILNNATISNVSQNASEQFSG